jgi:protein-L-isoaspartate(D-aspartate) O-methyltransferase
MARHAQDEALALEVDNLIVETGPLAQGAPEAGPYDVILVEGAVSNAPEALIAQLKEGGRLVAVMQDGPHGHARLFSRTASGCASRRLFDATAPLLPGFEPSPAFEF